ncbi:lytic transglycosylase [Pseudothermotoga hypogea DSM 11164 = NBRC 106472]|uniref:Lytic transglycosylase n=1 Tax=Pseudothermotoga hypogea DSM 11164 = NBRC 106472 TaxID=1123384 RepID=A0A0X1KP47_9THEM|nr:MULTISPECIES: lytic transglycosylase domain-containing protein [Pseudothermotoga]AJC73032.1 lytic transglycosylase [Pseudothermotoga hypogea DSM 11164 = NBRC 106472]MBC7121825.1 lytic transglycosylase domain-containing protein [Pseudothermotoga sp.]MDI6863260.1 lytic transglycosylase domain-containing protein [Pseudothermotoga sp.]
MRKILCLSLLSVVFSVLVSNPLVFLNDPRTTFCFDFQVDRFRFSLFLPLVRSIAPIDWFLPKENAVILKGLIKVESDFFVHALSEKGAMGLTQLMPSTAKELGVLNPFNVFQSVDGANRYLKDLQKRFNSVNLALAAYYEGPTRVARQGPSVEGLKYAQKVLNSARDFENRTAFFKDAVYFEPYFELGKHFSGGVNFYLSLLGVAYLTGGLNVSDRVSQHVFVYPNITDSVSLILGERDLNLVGGFFFRKMPDFGIQLLVGKNELDVNALARVWRFYITAGFSQQRLRVGFIFK